MGTHECGCTYAKYEGTHFRCVCMYAGVSGHMYRDVHIHICLSLRICVRECVHEHMGAKCDCESEPLHIV